MTSLWKKKEFSIIWQADSLPDTLRKNSEFFCNSFIIYVYILTRARLRPDFERKVNRMKKTFNEKTIKLIKESNEFGIDDRLTDIMKRNEELSLDELELVTAAASPDFERFKNMLNGKK